MDLFRVLYMKKTGQILPNASLHEILFARLNGSITKTIDWTPSITVNDAIAGAVIDYQIKITAKQSGTGTPSPSNICPITGWTGANITRAGINLFIAENPTSGYISGSDGTKKGSSTWRCSETYSPVKGGTTYTLSKVGTSSSSSAGWACYDENYNRVGGSNYGDWVTNVITLPENARYFRASWRDTADNPIMLIPSGVTVPTEYTAYETPTVYPVSWQSEAGTVYGGVLDVTTGTLTVTHTAEVYDGTEEGWGEIIPSGWGFYIPVSGSGYTRTELLKCSCLIGSNAGSSASMPLNSIMLNSNKTNLLCRVDTTNDFPTLDSWKAFLTQNPMTVLFPLAEPITYNLTPTEITLAEGANTIWSDTGDSKLTYKAGR